MTADRDLRGIAIIGMACRFPGSPDLGAFWENLAGGTDCIRHFTEDELRAAGVPEGDLANPAYVKAAPVINGFDMFDAGFFEYSPREARIMDPQQRILLECAWHALEDAGRQAGGDNGRVGAFMGSGGVVTSYLMAQRGLHGSATGGVEHLGNDKDFVSTKLSYKLGLTGPSINVQTACSTSLVAVHLACQSILDGECDMALAGAATVRVPHLTGYVHRPGDIASPDGRCRAYDAEAEGTVFGSGTGIVVLKHVEDAVRDGDRIYAVIRGSAINNDGAAKVSYTASSTEGQARAMAAAFAAAEVGPSTIGYVEGHGTGTVVGDPLEVEALRRCFVTDPQTLAGGCYLGSVKTNIGHLEQTAGVASLIKAALALHHGRVPPSLNFRTPNPRIDFANGPFVVPTAPVDWAGGAGPRRAAVNSLGLGGTNAFAILEEAPEVAEAAALVPPVHMLMLSARSQAALGVLVDRWRDHLAGLGPAETSAACLTAAEGRAALKHRIAVAGPDAAALSRALIERGRTAAEARAGRKLAFLFPGQGAQYPGMARDLHASQPVFRERFDEICALIRAETGLDIAALVLGDDAAALADTTVQQPALFAIEWALAGMLEGFGLRPDAVIGHSAGAFAAAAVAGIYTAEDAARLICRRAGLMGALPKGGAMAALFAGEDEVAGLCKGISGACIAGLNSPSSTVISGSAKAVASVCKRAETAGIEARPLKVSHAFHSPLMEPAARPLAEFGRGIAAQAPKIAFVSDMTGAVLEAAPDGDYLADHLLSPVRFSAGLGALAGLGCTDFIEVGPGAALRGFAAATLGGEAELHGVLDPKGGDWPVLAKTLGGLWEKGYPVEAGAFYAGTGARRTAAPLYPFERQRYWLEEAAPEETGWQALSLPGPARHFQARYSAARQKWLPDHRVYGHLTLPVAEAMLALAEMGGRAAKAVVEVRDLTYAVACLFGEEEERLLDLESSGTEAALASQPRGGEGDAPWQGHIQAALRPLEAGAKVADLAAMRAACPVEADPGAFYAALDRLGLNYGPGFRNVRELHLGPGAALGRVALAAPEVAMTAPLLDACLHLFPAVSGFYGDFTNVPEAEGTFLPISVERFALLGPVPGEVWSHCALREGEAPEEGRYTVDIRMYASDGSPVAAIGGLTVKLLEREAFVPREKTPVEDWLYGLDWVARPALPEPEAGAGRWLVVAERAEDAEPLIYALEAAGAGGSLLSADDLLAGRLPDPADQVAGVLLATALAEPPLMLQETEDLSRTSERQFRVTKAALDLTAETLHGQGQPKLWFLTRGAQAPLDDGLGGEALQAALWGHGRVVALEHAAVFGGLIDIDERTGMDMVARELLSPDGEDQVALRQGRRHAPRLVRREVPGLDRPVAPPVRADRSYLVTGGLGVLGLKVAAWLQDQGARHLWLVSRRAPGEAQRAAIAALEVQGAVVQVVSADVADADEAAALIARIGADGPQLDGLFHCAGLLDDGVISSMDWERYHRVTAPKIEGTWALHLATQDLDLGHFVMFSSILSVIGSMGQLNYVAGNAFQDALVAYRRRLGLAAVAINWGPWEEAGLATESGERGRAIWRARGTEYIPADAGLEAMTQTLAHGFDHMVVTLTDWPKFVAQFAEAPRLYERLADRRAQPARRVAVDRAKVMEQLRAAAPEDRLGLLTEALGQICAQNLQLDAPPPPDLSLREAGLDSLLSITVINDIESVFGTRLAARALLRGPSVSELAEMVLEALPDLGAGAERPRPRARPADGKPGQWLVTRRPRPEARCRLICFPFAGGGSAVFDSWPDAFDPAIEIVAVEPPGRLGRINEAPVRTVEDFARGLLPELTKLLDKPYGMLGHCLGGLTLYETLRFLEARELPMPSHIFVSGARPPSVLRAPGDFEAELEERLRNFDGYRSGTPGFEQPDEVFAEIVRAFAISESSKMLDVEELRELVLPTVRAEFAMSNRYVYLPEDPFPVPITCFRGERDAYFRDIDARIWGKFTSEKFELFSRDTGHFAIVEDFDFICSVIEDRLLGQCAEPA